ncbi:MAG: hypothetical protein CFK52_13170 [Chloracidobacterium sp. CP2_5A]|nr:MAG: hypothetical protein CFK52_13170 [Chloracidobacterium sp. CP2_5A]
MTRFIICLFAGAFALLSLAAPAATSRRAAGGDWLDQPLTDWNRPDGRLPSLPAPANIPDIGAPAVCNERTRQPVTAAERALVKRGWKLFGAAQAFDMTQVVMAATGFDEMCRPLGYQAFVYWEGRYAGTLAPSAMNARADGALVSVKLLSPTRLVAEFDRYAAGDRACCPSRTATVSYALRRDDLPALKATDVTHRPACPGAAEPPTDAETPAAALGGRRWTLAEIGAEAVSGSECFIEFNPSSKRVVGSDGCNRFMGSYESQGDRLKFSRLAGTKRACLDEAARKLEMRFNRALPKVNRFAVTDNQLMLYNGGQLLMTLNAK